MGSTQESGLRVCHLGKYYPPAPGGIETHVRTLARAQAELGVDVRVACVNHANLHGRDVTWSRRGATPTLEERDGDVRVTRLGRSAHFAKLDIVPGICDLFRSLKHDPVDVIHLHTPNPTMLLAMSVLRPHAPVVITHHSDIVKQRMLYRAFEPFENIVYARAAKIITNSSAYVSGSDRLMQHRDKVETVPMGLDLEPFLNPSEAALRYAASLRAKYGSPLWLSVGRCVYYKGYDTAIRALRHVPGKLIIVGKGPYKESLMRSASELGVGDRIIWLSYMSQDELVGAYHAATAFWLSSNQRSEAFGLVQVEAMATGCPVINTAIPHSGVSWVSRHGETGLTAGVNAPQEFAAAARQLVDDSELRHRLGESARRRAVGRFEQSVMAARTLDLYRRVVGIPEETPVEEASVRSVPKPAFARGLRPAALVGSFQRDALVPLR